LAYRYKSDGLGTDLMGLSPPFLYGYSRCL